MHDGYGMRSRRGLCDDGNLLSAPSHDLLRRRCAVGRYRLLLFRQPGQHPALQLPGRSDLPRHSGHDVYGFYSFRR